MKKYIIGHFCSNNSEFEVISKEGNRAILDILKHFSPSGLNAYELAEKTGLPLKTVYPSLKELNREQFIKELSKQPNKPGRPSTKIAQSTESDRYRASFVVEDMSRIYEHVVSSEIEMNLPLAPGNVDYPPGFLDAWHNTIEKKEEDEMCTYLLAFLEKMFRRINEHESGEIRKWAPKKPSDLQLVSRHGEQDNSEENSDFCCTQCGVNHEARDFVRAAMLHLIDHLEKNDNFIRFMKQNQFINQEIYHNMIARKSGRFKEPDMKINV